MYTVQLGVGNLAGYVHCTIGRIGWALQNMLDKVEFIYWL